MLDSGGEIPYFGRHFDKRSPKTSTCIVFVCKRFGDPISYILMCGMWGTLAGTFQDSHDGGAEADILGHTISCQHNHTIGPRMVAWRDYSHLIQQILWGKPAQSHHRMYLLKTWGILCHRTYKNSFPAETENLPRCMRLGRCFLTYVAVVSLTQIRKAWE
jgi:hypothetical protein